MPVPRGPNAFGAHLIGSRLRDFYPQEENAESTILTAPNISAHCPRNGPNAPWRLLDLRTVCHQGVPQLTLRCQGKKDEFGDDGSLSCAIK